MKAEGVRECHGRTIRNTGAHLKAQGGAAARNAFRSRESNQYGG